MADQTSSEGILVSEILKVLLEHEKENNAFIRHYEDVRFKVTQINVTLSILLIGASRFENLHASKVLLSVFIAALGIQGILVSAKYTERADRHATISRSYRRALSKIIGTFEATTMEEIHRKASEIHQSDPGIPVIIADIRARWFWYAINFAIVMLGIFVAFT